ncbi:MAG: spermidine/putrescine ABC transporter substrate-binding protein [Oscillospiraceae bacterium]|nr:spermidine/putrescine ABC transporter substrate-binding protein [Oscillospiraceae bacterium]
MKKKLCILLCLLLSLPWCLTSCKKYESEINVYNWGEYISDGSEDTYDVIREFELKYNIKVNYTEYDSNEYMYNVLKNNTGSAYDILVPSEYMVAKLIEEDMVQKINFENIPNYKYIDEKYKNLPFDPNNEYSIPYFAGTLGIVYNKTMVDEEVDSWEILWDEKYKEKIFMIDNSRDAFAVALTVLGYDPNNCTKEQIDEAMELLKKQRPLVYTYGMDQVFNCMEQDQCALGVYYAGDAVTMMENNENLDFVVPKEGSNMFVDSIVIPKNAENKEGAEKFINFLLDPEVSAANAEYVCYTSCNEASYELIDEEIIEDDIIYPDEEVYERCFYFSNMEKELYDYLQKAWIKVQI